MQLYRESFARAHSKGNLRWLLLERPSEQVEIDSLSQTLEGTTKLKLRRMRTESTHQDTLHIKGTSVECQHMHHPLRKCNRTSARLLG